MVSLEFFIGM